MRIRSGRRRWLGDGWRREGLSCLSTRRREGGLLALFVLHFTATVITYGGQLGRMLVLSLVVAGVDLDRADRPQIAKFEEQRRFARARLTTASELV